MAAEVNTTNTSSSRWWGESFIEELTRISDRAAEKLRVRREGEEGQNGEVDGKQADESSKTSGNSTPRLRMGSRSHTYT